MSVSACGSIGLCKPVAVWSLADRWAPPSVERIGARSRIGNAREAVPSAAPDCRHQGVGSPRGQTCSTGVSTSTRITSASSPVDGSAAGGVPSLLPASSGSA